MTSGELIGVLRHYAALYPNQVCPPGVLIAAAEALGAAQSRRSRKVDREAGSQDVAPLPAMRHDME